MGNGARQSPWAPRSLVYYASNICNSIFAAFRCGGLHGVRIEVTGNRFLSALRRLVSRNRHPPVLRIG